MSAVDGVGSKDMIIVYGRRQTVVGGHRNSVTQPRFVVAEEKKTAKRKKSIDQLNLADLKISMPSDLSSMADIQSPHLMNKDSFLALFGKYVSGERPLKYVIKVLKKDEQEIRTLLGSFGQEFIVALGSKQEEFISELMSEEVKSMQKTAPFRENSLATAFYREFCIQQFGPVIKRVIEDTSIFASSHAENLLSKDQGEVGKARELLAHAFISKICSQVHRAEVKKVKTVHKNLKVIGEKSGVANLEGFVISTFFNRVTNPALVKEAMALLKPERSFKVLPEAEQRSAIYRSFAIVMQKFASQYQADSSKLSPKMVAVFQTLADLLFDESIN